MKRKHFSLIELLIVIAVMAILVAMLMPALVQAKNLAKDTVGLSNEKQMGVAFAMYHSENDRIYPSHKKMSSLPNQGNNDWLAVSWIEYIGIEDKGIFRCPRISSWTYTDGTDTWEVQPKNETVYDRTNQGSYGYNGWWLGTWPQTWGPWYNTNREKLHCRVSEVATPSQLIVVSDSSPRVEHPSYQDHLNPFYSSTIWYPLRKNTLFWTNEGVKPGHGPAADRTNILWADGHVSPELAYPINFDDNYRDLWNPNPDLYQVNN